MSSPISLIEIPEVAMKHIFEYLDFPSILVLRKVCHDLRNFIDDIKPASHFTEIRIDVCREYINFILYLSRSSCWFIDYEKHGKGCLVKYREEIVKETILEDEDYVRVFCKDFNIILRHQKTVLEKFNIVFYFLDSTDSTVCDELILENANQSLKSRNHPLQMKSLYMTVSNHDEIMSILPYIDPKPLELIHFDHPSRNFDVMLNLNDIGQLEQWKQAKKLKIQGFQLPPLDQNFQHFSKITLHLREVTAEVLISLKKMFLSSSTLYKMRMYCNNDVSQDIISQKLIETFGQPFVDSDQERNWFFRTSNTNQLLTIKLRYIYIHFDCIEQSDVPQNAVILN